MKPAPHSHRPRQGGFTLLELMVTVSVLAILTTVAVPAYSNLIANQRAKAAALDLYTDLIRSRSEALKRRSSITLQASSTVWESGWLVADASSATLSVHDATPTITIRAANGTSNPAAVVYQSSGRLAGGTAPTFVVASSAVTGIAYCVSADLSGRPFMTKGSTC